MTDSAKRRSRSKSNFSPGFWPEVIGALGAITLAMLAITMGLGQPSRETLEYRPVPDAAEYAWVASQFARGGSPLLPIANELYLSRYSPIHPELMALWIKLHGGQDRAMFTWSAAAFLAGLALMYLWMARIGMSPFSRLTAMAVILCSPMIFQLCSGLYQEPTHFLIFWFTLLCWHIAISRMNHLPPTPILRPFQPIILISAGLFAGIGAGALAMMRTTTGTLAVLIFVYLVVMSLHAKKFHALIGYAIGCLAIAIGAVYYNHAHTGLLSLTAYHIWIPQFHTWSHIWPLLYTPDPFLGDEWRIDVLLSSFMGRETSLHPLGLVSGALIFLGLLVHPAAYARNLNRSKASYSTSSLHHHLNIIALVLMIFMATQIINHIAYRYWSERFFAIIYPLWIVLGVAGVERLVRGLLVSFPQYKRAVIALAASLIVLTTGIYRYPLIGLAITDVTRPADPPEHRDAFTRVHQFFGPLIKREAAPLFVDRLPILNARLLLDLDMESYPYPVSQYEFQNDLFWDGHTVQFLMFNPIISSGQLNPGAPWPPSPHLSHLVNLKQRELNATLCAELLNHYGKIIIYMNIHREHRLELLLDWARENGIELHWRLEHDSWVMIVLTGSDVTSYFIATPPAPKR